MIRRFHVKLVTYGNDMDRAPFRPAGWLSENLLLCAQSRVDYTYAPWRTVFL